MTFYHVLAEINSEKAQMLFSDLTLSELGGQFVTPYKRGKTFFSGSRLINPAELKAIHIIETTECEAAARQRINEASLQQIAEINRTGIVSIFSPGSGYAPEDLLEAGTDITRSHLKGGPGSSVALFGMSKQAADWTLGIVAAAASTGLAKWLRWA